MVNKIWATEGQVHGEKNLHSGMQDPPNPDHHHQELAEPLSHDGRVAQRLADGHVAIIGHDSENDGLWCSQEVLHKELSQAATPGHGSPPMQQVSDHVGGGDTAEGGIYEGQVHEKEVHGSRKCGAEGDGDDNEQVGQHGKQENEQKDNEEHFLQVWILCESQENKFSHIVGRHWDTYLGSNTFLGTRLPTKNKEWYLLIMK